MVVSPPKGDGPPTTGKAVQPHASNALAGNKPAPTVRAVLRQRLDAATDTTPLPPAVVSGAVWREEAMRTEEVFEAELRMEVLEAELLEHVEPHPPNSSQSQQPVQTPSSGMSDAGCIGDAAYGVDPEFLSKVSHSRQSSKPPFLWNPYLWYLGHSQGVSPRREYTRRIHALGLTTRHVLQAVVWMSVLPSMIMQSTRNMIEDWDMLADVTKGWTASRLLQEAEVAPAPTWQESFGDILAANVFERFASETQQNHGMRPTERQEHVLIAAMMARDDPVDAVTLLREHNRVDHAR